MKLFLTLAIGFAFCTTLLASGQDSKTQTSPGTEWSQQATRLEAQRDWPGLLEWSQEWIEAEPQSSMAWFAMGAAYDGLGSYEDSITAYSRSIRLNTRNPSSWNNLGHAYLKEKRFDVASEAFGEATELRPDFDVAWSNLGLAYAEMGLPEEAIDAYRTAISIHPTPGYWRLLGIAYGQREMKRWKAADYQGEMDYAAEIDAYSEALRLKPNDTSLLYTLAMTYAWSGDLNEARALQKRLTRLDPAEADRLSVDIAGIPQ